MVEIKSILKNINSFQFYSDGIILLKDENLKLLDNDLKTRIICNQKIFAFFYFNNKIFFQKENGRDFEGIDSTNNSTIKIEGNYYLWKNCITKNGVIIAGKNKTGKAKFFFNNEFEITEIPLRDMPSLVLKKENLINIRGLIIESVTLKGEIKWQLDVSEIGRHQREGKDTGGTISSFVYHKPSKTLILAISINHVLGIDIETGKIKWRFAIRGGHFNMALYEDKVFAICNEVHPEYYIFKAETGEIIKKTNLATLWQPFAAPLNPSGRRTTYYWYMTPHTVDEDYLYVSSWNQKELGIFDKHTAEEIERIPLKGANNYIPRANAPVVIGNRIYQLDGDKQLHVFEREN